MRIKILFAAFAALHLGVACGPAATGESQLSSSQSPCNPALGSCFSGCGINDQACISKCFDKVRECELTEKCNKAFDECDYAWDSNRNCEKEKEACFKNDNDDWSFE